MINYLHIALPLLQSNAYNTAGTTLIPLVFIALMLDALVVAVWYFVGSLLNNPRIKGVALGEFYQFIGTVILIGILLGSMLMVSSIFYTSYSTTTLMSPTAISSLCGNVEKTSQLNILGGANSLLAGANSVSGNTFTGLCSMVNLGGSSTLTDKINYPLAASAVILANLTNQTAANLNSSFTMDAWLGFQSNLSATINVCVATKNPSACIVPNLELTPEFDLETTFTPYAGYSMLIGNLNVLKGIFNLSVESFVAQLLFIAMFLYAWPWLLFGGIVLRSTLFTRRIGGLLIAIALAGLFIYPTVLSLEYLSLGKGFTSTLSQANAGNYNATYGYNVITSLPATPNSIWPNAGNTMAGNYVINYFVEPNIHAIAWTYNCWPNLGGKPVLSSPNAYVGSLVTGSTSTSIPSGLSNGEGIDIGYLLVPLTSVLTLAKYTAQLGDSAELGSPAFNLPAYCRPTDALSTFFALLDSYGIIGVIAFLIPLINIVVTMSSIVGLSGLMGGDTELAGLAKLL